MTIPIDGGIKSGVAYAVPDLETGGPILKITVANGEVVRNEAVAWIRADPGYRLCRAIVCRNVLPSDLH